MTQQEIVCPQPPGDSISSLCFNPVGPQNDMLCVTSWDSSVRIYEVSNGVNPVALTNAEAPVLCSAFSADGTKVIYAGCDNKVRLWDLATKQETQIGSHEMPIKSCFMVPELNHVVATGSWDKTVRFWDGRQQNPVHQIQLPERCYAMDVKHPVMVVGTAGRQLMVYDLTNLQNMPPPVESPLKYQTRCVSIFTERNGYAVGSIEGRVGIQYISGGSNFAFKCHRGSNQDVYAVNSISFHPEHGTFATAGSDGTFHMWDKNSKQRLKAFKSVGSPIPCSDFSRNGSMYAYAVSYDWSQGAAAMSKYQKNEVRILAVQDPWVRRR